MKNKTLFIIVILLFFQTYNIISQEQNKNSVDDDHKDKCILPFSFGDTPETCHLPIFVVKINGESFKFSIDTGGLENIIFESGLEKFHVSYQENIPTKNSIINFLVSLLNIKTNTYVNCSVELFQIENLAIQNLDLKYSSLNYPIPGIDAILCLAAFKNTRSVIIDYKNKVFVFNDSIYERNEFPIYTEHNRYYIKGIIEDNQVNCLLDNGAANVLVFDKKYFPKQYTKEVVNISTLNGISNYSVDKAKHLDLQLNQNQAYRGECFFVDNTFNNNNRINSLFRYDAFLGKPFFDKYVVFIDLYRMKCMLKSN